MSNRPGSIVFGVVVGLAVAFGSYRWISDPSGRAIREQQEQVVLESRALVIDKLGLRDPEIVDPLAPKRSVGKVYVYPVEGGWEVSGYYRRDEDDDWHPYLITLDSDVRVTYLKVQDDAAEVATRAESDPLLDVLN